MRRRNRCTQSASQEVTTQDAQLAEAVRLSVEQTLLAMGVVPQYLAKPQKEIGQPVKTIDLIGMFFYVLEKFGWVLLTALVFAVLFGVSSNRSVPTYTATAKLYIVNPTNAGISMADLQLGTVLTLDYQEVFKTWEVHEMVRQQLDLPYTYEQMQSLLTVTNPEDTRILYISATYFDAQTAADIANAYASAAKEFIISTMKGEEPSDFSIALVPGTARTVSRVKQVIVGFLVGSLLAAGVLVLLFVLDDRPRTPEDVSVYGGIPTLAVLPYTKEMRRMHRRRKRKRAKGA